MNIIDIISMLLCTTIIMNFYHLTVHLDVYYPKTRTFALKWFFFK